MKVLLVVIKSLNLNESSSLKASAMNSFQNCRVNNTPTHLPGKTVSDENPHLPTWFSAGYDSSGIKEGLNCLKRKIR
jgi:hypothetical protein